MKIHPTQPKNNVSKDNGEDDTVSQYSRKSLVPIQKDENPGRLSDKISSAIRGIHKYFTDFREDGY